MARPHRGPRRRSKGLRFASAVLLAAVLVAGFAVVNNDLNRRARVFNPTVALVNEDLPADFNDASYTFGTNFVDRVSKDSDYNWTVLSRPIAEKAYKDGSVDAIVTLPQSFSHDILTLQNIDPTKATIEYKLRPQPDETSDRVLQSRIVDIVTVFNQSVVKMYYASIADNVAEADGSMHAALDNQGALIAALTSDVEEPFSGTMPNFEGFRSSASGLKDVNASTVEAQNTFTGSVTDTLTRTSETFSGTLPDIDEYANRQKDIAQINAANSNEGIATQADSDRTFYGSQFDALKTSMMCALSGVDPTELAAPCARPDGTVPPYLAGELASLRQSIADYATEYTGAVDTLQTTIERTRTTLDERIATLKALAAILEPHVIPAQPGQPGGSGGPGGSAGSGGFGGSGGSGGSGGPGGPNPITPTLDPAVLETLNAEIDALQASKDALSVTTPPAPHFEVPLSSLDAWYLRTLTVLTGSTLTTSAVNTLEVSDWTRFDPDHLGLYIDNSDDLHRTISGLVTQTAQASSSIAAGSTTVPDNSPLFDALLRSADATFQGAETVHNGVSGLLSTGSADLRKNQQYYQGFSTVLANTRTQGADTGKIHDFFSAPIAAKNITPERVAVPSTLDLRWMAIFAGGLLAGALVTMLGRVFRRRKRA